MSHTFSPADDKRRDTVICGALVLCAVTTVIVMWPPEGWVLSPVHTALDMLLGRATFLVPIGCALVGALGLVRRARPDVVFPKRRLLGLGVIALALVPSERLLGGSMGLVGDWLTGFLVELGGGPFAILLSVTLMSVGTVLAFDLRPGRPPFAAR